VNGQLLHTLKHHIDNIFSVYPHPQHKEIVLSAGNDGVAVFWDVYSGRNLKSFTSTSVPFLEAAISPLGHHIAITDEVGCLHLYGLLSSTIDYQKRFAPHLDLITYHSTHFPQKFVTDTIPVTEVNGVLVDASNGTLIDSVFDGPVVDYGGVAYQSGAIETVVKHRHGISPYPYAIHHQSEQQQHDVKNQMIFYLEDRNGWDIVERDLEIKMELWRNEVKGGRMELKPIE